MAKQSDNIESEEWRAVLGFEGLYEVSSHGRVRSLARVTTQIGKGGAIYSRSKPSMTLRPGTAHGYHFVILRRDGVSINKKVARMVCEAFHGPAESSKIQAAHLNNIRNDDRPENLVWATCRENNKHKLLHGTQPRGETSYKATITEDQVRSARARRLSGESFNSIARTFNVSRKVISRAVHRETWAHVE